MSLRAGIQPRERSFRAFTVRVGDIGEAFRLSRWVDHPRGEQGSDEVAVLLSQRTQLRDAKILFVEAPACELWLSGGWGGVGVLQPDQPVAPTHGEHCGLQIDSVNAETM